MDGCDRISGLPESLLTQILSHLPTKDSVKTSLLSKRWESLWLRVPGLELALNDFPDGQALESFVNKFLEFNKDSRMQKFIIQSMQSNDDRLVEWIDTAIVRGVELLYVETINAPNATQNIYRTSNLGVVKNLRVRSQTLKTFCLIFEHTWGGTNFLECLSVRDHQSDRIVMKNLSSLLMVDIDTNFAVTFGSILILPSKIETIQDFFAGISGVKYMIISYSTLEAEFSDYTLQLLPMFLESCPNLRELMVDFEAFVLLPTELELSYVPWCLISTLVRVCINKLITKEESGIKLVNYFLENSAVLKELTMSFFNSPLTNEEREIFKNLPTSTKRSRGCQVSIY